MGAEEHRNRSILSLHAMVLRKYSATRDAFRLPSVVELMAGCAVEEFCVGRLALHFSVIRSLRGRCMEKAMVQKTTLVVVGPRYI